MNTDIKKYIKLHCSHALRPLNMMRRWSVVDYVPTQSVGTMLVLVASCFLSACAVGPDYKKPTSKVPASFEGASYGEFSARDVEVSWWRLFNDPLLNTLVQQTLQNNYDLKAAQANLSEARALYLESGLNLLPIVTSHANYTESRRSTGSLNNRSFVPRGLKLFNTGFDASWELDFFGRVRRNFEASSDEVEAEEASLRDISVSLIAEVARNYFELRGLQNQLAVAQKNADIQKQTLDLTLAKLENGRGTELDTERATAQLEATRAGIPTLVSAISRTSHRLSVLTGQMPSALTQTLDRPVVLPKAPDTIEIGNPAQLLQRRPDIKYAERTLAAATARIGVAIADLFPRVTFVGSISLEANTLSAIAGPASDTYSVGPKISWAAFDLGRVYARIKAADARAESSLDEYQQTVLNALEETENALVTYNQERARRASLVLAVQASEKANDLAKLRYKEGVSDFLALLDSEQRLLESQNQLAVSETVTATALTAVYKALGGGWQVMEAKS